MRNYNSQISSRTNFVGTHPCMRPIKDGTISKMASIWAIYQRTDTQVCPYSFADPFLRQIIAPENYPPPSHCNVGYSNYLNSGLQSAAFVRRLKSSVHNHSFPDLLRAGKGDFPFCNPKTILQGGLK